MGGLSIHAALLVFAMTLIAAHRGAAQMLVGSLSERLGRSRLLLMIALVTAIATSGLAALAGAWLGSMVTGFERALIAAGALVIGTVLLIAHRNPRLPEEPTRSLGAITLAQTAKQLLDPPRLVIFASAASLADVAHAWSGGGLATSLSLSLGWALGTRAVYRKRRPTFLIFAAIVLLALAVLIAWAEYVPMP